MPPTQRMGLVTTGLALAILAGPAPAHASTPDPRAPSGDHAPYPVIAFSDPRDGREAVYVRFPDDACIASVSYEPSTRIATFVLEEGC